MKKDTKNKNFVEPRLLQLVLKIFKPIGDFAIRNTVWFELRRIPFHNSKDYIKLLGLMLDYCSYS